MQNSVRFTRGWHILLDVLMAVRAVRQWLLPATILALALAVGNLFDSSVVQGQRGRTRLSVNYELEIHTEGRNVNRICMGQSVSLPVTLSIRATGSSDALDREARVRVRASTPTVSARDTSIVEVQRRLSPGYPPGTEFPFELYLTGKSAGTTMVEVRVTVTRELYEDEEIRLPLGRPTRLLVMMPVRVVRCEYHLTGFSSWQTNIYSASVLIQALFPDRSIPDGVIMTSRSGIYYSSEPGQSFYELFVQTNRLPACDADSNTFRRQPLLVSGEIVDDELVVTIEYPLPYERAELSCFGDSRTTREWREMGERHITAAQEIQNFVPQTLRFSVPVDGGTVYLNQGLDFRSGSVTGRASIIVTPITE